MINHKKVQALIDSAYLKLNAPGISVTITENGQHTSFNAGYRDIKNEVPMTEHTMQAIGSSTKAFVATAICILVDQGKLMLDDPVKKYLPGFQMYDKYAEENLTIRDILCHRCGLPRHELTWYTNEHFTTKDLIDKLRYLKPFTTFRNKFCYQNLMYALAGYLVEEIAGKPWTEFVHEQIAMKIGAVPFNFHIDNMRDSGIGAIGYAYDSKKGIQKPQEYKQLENVGAAGSINSTTAQMVKWIDLQLNEGKCGEEVVISESTIKECHKPQTPIDLSDLPVVFPNVDLMSYGLGWFIQSYNGHKLLQHGGNIDGFSAMHFFLPGTGFGASILTNGNGNASRDVIMYGLIDILFEDSDMDWVQFAVDAVAKILSLTEEQKKKDRILPLEYVPFGIANKNCEGVYSHPAYGEFIITSTEDQIMAKFGTMHLTLEHHTATSFFACMQDENLIEAQLKFVTDFSGTIQALEINLEPMLTESIVFIREKVS